MKTNETRSNDVWGDRGYFPEAFISREVANRREARKAVEEASAIFKQRLIALGLEPGKYLPE